MRDKSTNHQFEATVATCAALASKGSTLYTKTPLRQILDVRDYTNEEFDHREHKLNSNRPDASQRLLEYHA